MSAAAFGPRLRAHRERCGITLESVARKTKIQRTLLDGLERGDVSKWPRGIFRRAYVREYAAAVGLDPQGTVDEFAELFPEQGQVPPAAPAGAGDPVRPAPAMRLSLATEPASPAGEIAARMVPALVELAAVFGVGALAAVLASAPLLTATGLVALVYYPVAAALSGRTAGVRQVRASIRGLSRTVVTHALAARRTHLRLVPLRRVPVDREAPDEALAADRRSAAS